MCKKAELLNCKNLVTHPLLGRFIALIGKGAFKAGFVTIECASGEGHSNQIESQQSGEFKGELESLAFATCLGCKKVAVKTPQVITLDMETETGGWKLHAKNAQIKFTECSLSQSCTYEGNLDLEVQMNEKEAFVEPQGAAFTKIEPSTILCAATGKWEKGTTSFDWELDDKAFPNGTRHPNVTASLIGNPHEQLGLCKKPELLLCATGNQVSLNGKLKLTQVGTGIFEAGLTAECKEGSGETETIAAKHYVGGIASNLTTLSFSNCNECENVKVATPQALELSIPTALGNDWYVSAKNTQVRLEKCGKEIECEYEGSFSLPVEMTETEVFIEPEEAEFKKVKGTSSLCYDTGEWSGKYGAKYLFDDLSKTESTIWPTLLGSSHKELGLCKKPELLLCATENQVGLNGKLKLTQGKGFNEFELGGAFVNECEVGLGETEIVEAKHYTSGIPAKLSSFTFSNCSPCKSVVVAIPQTVILGMAIPLGNDWLLSASNVKVTFKECEVLQECTYEGDLELPAEMTETEAFVEPKGASFKRIAPSTALCAATGKWSGKYRGKYAFDDSVTEGTAWPTLLGE